MQRLAVCGWEEQTPRWLAALRAQAGLVPTAIGDPRASRLVRARAELGLPCYQHLHELIRSADYDALLLDGPADTADLAAHAGARGAALLLSGAAADGETLAAVATTAGTSGVPLVVLRPQLRRAAFEAVRETIASEAAWAPTLLDLRIRQPRAAAASLSDAVAFACDVLGGDVTEVAVSRAGTDPGSSLAVTAHLRFRSGQLATMSAIAAQAEHLAITWEAPAGSATISATGETTLLRLEPTGAEPRLLQIADGDSLDREAARAARLLAGEGSEAFSAPREAAALQAIERALRTGQVQPVLGAPVRPALRVLRGGGHVAAADAALSHTTLQVVR